MFDDEEDDGLGNVLSEGEQETTDVSELDDSALEELLGAERSANDDAGTDAETVDPAERVDVAEKVDESTAEKEEIEGVPAGEVDPLAFITDETVKAQATDLFAKLQKQVADKEQMLQRQSQEVGERRKFDIREAMKNPEALGLGPDFNNQFYADPQKAMAEFLGAVSAQQDKQEAGAQETEGRFVTAIPGIETAEYRNQLADFAAKQGTPEEALNEFRATPFTSDPLAVAQLARDFDAAKFEEEKTALVAAHQKEIAALRDGKNSVAAKIQQAALRPGQLRAGMGQVSSKDIGNQETSDFQIANMTDAQLAELQKGK